MRAAATTHARTYVRVTTTIPRRDELSWTSAQQDEDEEERGGEEDFPHCLKIGLDLAVVAAAVVGLPATNVADPHSPPF